MPSENEKLRNLLAEAGLFAVDGCECNWRCEHKKLRERIDAALAEPVEDMERAWHHSYIQAQEAASRLERERNEAWAEVERLRSLKPVGTYSLDWNHEQERLRLTAERDAAKAEVDSLRLALEGAENSIKAHQEHEIRLKAELFDLAQDFREGGVRAGKTIERERIRRQVEEFARMAPIGPDEMETISEYDSDGWWHADDVLAGVRDEMENKS